MYIFRKLQKKTVLTSFTIALVQLDISVQSDKTRLSYIIVEGQTVTRTLIIPSYTFVQEQFDILV